MNTNYKETQKKIAAVFNEYCKIKDEDINAIAEYYPLTAQAIYDVQKAAPEVRVKVITVIIPKDVLDSADGNVDAACIAVRNELCKRFNNELNNLMMSQREYGDIAQANHIVDMTNRAFSNLATELQDSAVSGVIRNELTFALNESELTDGKKITHPEMCVAAIIKDIENDPDVRSWYAQISDYTVATALYRALQTMTYYDWNLAKRNAAGDGILADLDAGEVVARNDQIPQGLFDNPGITMNKLQKYLNGMTNHFDAVVLGDDLGFDPNHFINKTDKQLVNGDYAQFNDCECVPTISMMLINDTPAVVVRYDVCNCDEVMNGDQTALILNCNHPEIAEYMDALANLENVATESAIAKYKSNHDGKEPKYAIIYDPVIWEFLGTRDCYGNVYAFDLDTIKDYTEYLSNDILQKAENYDKTGNPYRSEEYPDWEEDDDEEDDDE